ncbi:MAG: hypothetical protein IH986_08515 [Planctomycetes bacterium]|nr:hypothetical protein [Planctomycetota bacterium]
METLAVGLTTSAVSTAPPRGLNNLSSEDFFKILVAEMQQQDPFAPTKTADMIGQVSQIRSIELSSRLTDTLDQMNRQQRLLGAADMIGKFVTALVTGADGVATEVSGIVVGVRFDSDGDAVLELDTGDAVPVSSVQRVTTLDVTESEARDPPPEAGSEISEATAKSKAAAKARGAAPRNWLSLDSSIRL